MANRYWVGGTGTWDYTSTANWSTTSGGSSGASVPTSTDDVFFDANSGGGTVDVQDFGSGLPSCAALDFTGFTGSFDSSSNALENYGDITLSSGGDFTLFVPNIYASCTFTSNGKQIQDFYAGGTGITVDLADDLNCSSGVFSFTEGTFTTNNFNVDARLFFWGALYSVNSTTINMGSSTFTINDSSIGDGWVVLYNTSPSEVTVNAGTSTISFNNTFASSIFLLDGAGFPPVVSSSGKTYYNLEINGTADVTIFGDNTFNTISNSTQPITINFAAGSTQTVTNFNVSGTAGNLVTLQSTTSGTQFTLSKASGTVSRDYLSIKDSAATGGAAWYAGANSTNVSNNTGWTFTAIPPNRYWVGGTGSWSSTNTDNWSATSGGATGAPVPTAADNVFFDAGSDAGGIFTVTMANSPRVCNDFTASGLDFTMTLAGSAIGLTVSGSLTFPATNFTRSYTGTTTFNATTTGKTVTTNGVEFGGGVVFTGVGGGWTLGSALTATGTSLTTLTNGTLNLASYTLTTGRFASNNSNTRTIAFGTGQITCTSQGTAWNTGNVTGLTTTGTQVVNFTFSGGSPLTVNSGSLSEANSISFNFTGGSYELNFAYSNGNSARSIDFTGSTCAWFHGGTNLFIYGGLKLSSGMYIDPTGSFTFGATSGTKNITTNGQTLDKEIIFDGVGGTFVLQDNLTLSGLYSTGTATLTNGTLDLNGKTMTVVTEFTTATGTKNLTFNGGTLICPTASSTAFNNAQPTNFTTTAGTGTGKISMTAATAKTFVGGGSTFNCTLNQGGAGALTITGSNTFNDITNTVQPASVLFTAGTTSTFLSGFSLLGTAGNLITIGSDTGAATHTLSKASGTVSADYLSISYSVATGGAAWYAGANSTNGGNNTGWTFTAPPAPGSYDPTRMLAFFFP